MVRVTVPDRVDRAGHRPGAGDRVVGDDDAHRAACRCRRAGADSGGGRGHGAERGGQDRRGSHEGAGCGGAAHRWSFPTGSPVRASARRSLPRAAQIRAGSGNVSRPQRTPAGRNWTEIRGPTGLVVLGTQWSQVRWHEPPMTTRSPCPAGTLIDVAAAPRAQHEVARGAHREDRHHRVLVARAADAVAVPGDRVVAVAVEAQPGGGERLAELVGVVRGQRVAGLRRGPGGGAARRRRRSTAGAGRRRWRRTSGGARPATARRGAARRRAGRRPRRSRSSRRPTRRGRGACGAPRAAGGRRPRRPGRGATPGVRSPEQPRRHSNTCPVSPVSAGWGLITG